MLQANPYVIETHGLSKTYKNIHALNMLDLQVHQNSIFGFLGPNGAGKTTTIKLMLGTLFDSREPVISIPLGVLFLQQNLIGFFPALRYVLPWNLTVPIGNTPSIVLYLMQNTPVSQDQLITLTVIVVESLFFISIGLWRFNREEF